MGADNWREYAVLEKKHRSSLPTSTESLERSVRSGARKLKSNGGEGGDEREGYLSSEVGEELGVKRSK